MIRRTPWFVRQRARLAMSTREAAQATQIGALVHHQRMLRAQLVHLGMCIEFMQCAMALSSHVLPGERKLDPWDGVEADQIATAEPQQPVRH